MNVLPRSVEIRHFHLFAGMGAGAKGMNKGHARVGLHTAHFRCLGGVDNNPGAVADFYRMTGVKGTLLDLFDRQQYTDFHGVEPPPEWRPATPEDIRRAAGHERPHIGFGSAPCKGFSGLLSEKKSQSQKYHALNQLALRGLRLALDAWQDDPLEFWLWENVPRIATRGRAVLDEMILLLKQYGYAVEETTHNCGELGGLAQNRNRFLLVARHKEKVPPFLYEPKKRRVRGVGEVIGRLPVPGPGTTLPMHRLPMLEWQTWVRLAFVEAGSDWRSLNRLRVDNGVLQDYALVPAGEWNRGVLGVMDWSATPGVITSRSHPTNGTFAVADPRVDGHERSIQHGVGTWQTPAAVVKGDVSVGTGRYAVADPRIEKYGNHAGKLRVENWQGATHVVTGSDRVGSGAMSIADPRLRDDQRWEDGRRGLGVAEWQGQSGSVTSQSGPNQGRYSVADPRIEGPRFNNIFRVVEWSAASPAVAGAGGPGNGLAIADPRTGYSQDAHRNKLRVEDWDASSGAVTGSTHVTGGALSVADPRVDDLRNTALGVKDWEAPSNVVADESHPTNGAFAVADPRPSSGWSGKGKYIVSAFEGPTNAVIAASTTGNGAFAVADPRAEYARDGKEVYKTSGEYGVVPWTGSSLAVTGSAKHDNGRWAVADPRAYAGEPLQTLPKPKEKLAAVIIALDGTFHRPFTTLELAFIQSLFDEDDLALLDPQANPDRFRLDGQSDSAWRERIGNAVPPAASEAIANVMATTLLLAWTGETFVLSDTPIWVRPIAVALSVKPDEAFQ